MAIHISAHSLIGQQSPFAPGVASDGTTFHMVFRANNPSGDLLYATSTDGLNWTRQPDVGEQSQGAAAVAILDGRVVAAYIANNPSNQLIVSVFDPVSGQWGHNTDSGESTGGGVSAVAANNKVAVYYPSNNPAKDLLEVAISFGAAPLLVGAGAQKKNY